ncbi:MAG: efflux RND transporter periplasmic adaptor subunit [Lentisphaeria bacterium]|nr:efflux RND transporter periplasmic adaptor subunit [Lentisphaeria bacterium]
MKRISIAVVAVIIAAAAVWGGMKLWKNNSKETALSFKLEKISRNNLRSTISASGTIEPEELINVGAQVNGKIMKFGIDADGKNVDYGSRITAGTVLARIDDVLYEAEVRQAEAAKLQAEAAIKSANANIAVSQADLRLAERNWARARELFPKKAMSSSDYDAAKAGFQSAKARIGVTEASLAQAKAQLAAAEASLLKAERNLNFCVITSPVDGVIIDRRVSVGQTVVSNMSASSIFLIAKDLKKMQVWASVNEADIGDIRPGMPVIFTVDTFPGQRFRGEVLKVRLNATMSQNVVTYIVEISADNRSGKLLPYLTANVRFIKASRDNVLTVSNAALRFQPEPHMVAPEFREKLPELLAMRRSTGRVLWKESSKGLIPVKVKTGLISSGEAEIVSGDIREGDEVVSGTEEAAPKMIKKSGGNGGSPFLPKPPQRKRPNLNPGRTQGGQQPGSR